VDAAREVADDRTKPDSGERFRPGQPVRHPRYGSGVILRVADEAVECDFGKRGARSFPLLLCPLLTEVESCRPFDRAPS
jgi:hypothetical protein